jgi:hypothetical protein
MSGAIPMLYKGTRFRSRLEAKWAAMFDALGWSAEYEALDLEGYIPDFIIRRPQDFLLVEVQGVLATAEMGAAAAKVDSSGWPSGRPALIVGASWSPAGVDTWPLTVAGVMRQAATAGGHALAEGLWAWCPAYSMTVVVHLGAPCPHCGVAARRAP